MIGKTYLEHGKAVTVTCQWRAPVRAPDVKQRYPHLKLRRTAPRNVEIKRLDGSRAVPEPRIRR